MAEPPNHEAESRFTVAGALAALRRSVLELQKAQLAHSSAIGSLSVEIDALRQTVVGDHRDLKRLLYREDPLVIEHGGFDA